MAHARGRFPRALADDRALWRVRDPAGLLARRLAGELRRARAVLRPRRIRARRVGQGRQPARQEDRRRQRVRGAAPARISAAAAASGPGRASVRRRRPASSAIIRSRRRARSSRSPTRAGRAAPIAASARRSAAMSARSRRSSSPSCPRPTPPATSSCITGAMCYRVNSDNSGRVTGVSYYGPDGSDNTIEADLVILDAVHLRQHAAAAAVEDRQVPQRPRQFERPPRQAHHGAHDGATCSSASTTATSTSSWGRARRSTRSTTSTPTISTTRTWASSAARRSRSAPATCEGGPIGAAPPSTTPPGVPRWGAGVSRLPRDILRAPCRHGGADREPALRRPDHRPRSERPRRLGPAGAAHDLRLAAAERARARRVHAGEDGGDRPRHGRAARLAGARQSGRRAGRAPPGRHAHGQRSEDFGREPLRPELGHSEPVRHRQFDLPDA